MGSPRRHRRRGLVGDRRGDLAQRRHEPLVIEVAIIAGISDSERLLGFYEQAYAKAPADAALYARWRALSAIGKADHVIALCDRARMRPASTLEVGCGDGALLCELHQRGFGGRLSGVEISEAAVAIARGRDGLEAVELYDGENLPFGRREYGLGILSHVLEHVPAPTALLAEVARVCRAVLVEVPLEANLSARRAGKREQSAEVGHLQGMDRAAARRIVEDAGLYLVVELQDPLELEVHRFFAKTPLERTAATMKWAVRAGVDRVAPPLARRLFTVHYAALCLPVE